MDVDIHPSKEGDFVPEDAILLDHINQVRLNRICLHRFGEHVCTEVNLVDWLMALTDLLNGCLKHDQLTIDRRMSFAGEVFHGSCESDGRVSLKIWDVDRRQRMTLHLAKDEAVELHEKVASYLKEIAISKLGGLDAIRDLKRIVLS